jgi:hypothetical protein
LIWTMESAMPAATLALSESSFPLVGKLAK